MYGPRTCMIPGTCMVPSWFKGNLSQFEGFLCVVLENQRVEGKSTLYNCNSGLSEHNQRSEALHPDKTV